MRRAGGFVILGVAVALVLAALVSRWADPNPDGLESAVLKTVCAEEPGPQARQACLDEAAGEGFAAAPLPDYANPALSGVLGVAVTFALGTGLVLLARRSRTGG